MKHSHSFLNYYLKMAELLKVWLLRSLISKTFRPLKNRTKWDFNGVLKVRVLQSEQGDSQGRLNKVRLLRSDFHGETFKLSRIKST